MAADQFLELKPMTDIQDASLLRHNTFGIAARCKRWIEFSSEEELLQVLPTIPRYEPLLVVGRGSNILFTKDFEGTVLRSDIPGIQVCSGMDGSHLRCGSGVEWDALVNFAVGQGIHGLENLALIPGDVGASAVQNIGAYGVEAKDFIERVEAIEIATGKKYSFTNADCQYGYRHSRFKDEWRGRFVITFVTYHLEGSFAPKLGYGGILFALRAKGITYPTAKELQQTIIDIRRAKLPDPSVLGSAGSFFVNPVVPRAKYEALARQYPAMPHYDVDAGQVKIPAAWLIEQCGWKGRQVGRVGVYEKQPLVLVNLGGATGEEVVGVSRFIRRDVKERFDIDIHPEVIIV